MPRRKEKKYHYIYKTTCNITGKYYYGMHSTDNLTDEYLGSGKRLKYSINKYGKENHHIEILEFFKKRKDLIQREKEIINESILLDPMCMNLILGGAKAYPEKYTKEKISRGLKNKSYDELYGDNSKEQKNKRSIGQKSYYDTLSPEDIKERNKKISEGVQKSMKKIKWNYPLLECPYCNKKGRSNAMIRWHFQNCKNNIINL